MGRILILLMRSLSFKPCNLNDRKGDLKGCLSYMTKRL
ncbi:hypothetical protein LEMLEM_LOCUS6407 [Lemmus lemmus]